MSEEQAIILFVDDKPSSHRYFRDQMDKSKAYQQYEIKLAFDLEEALDILDSPVNRTIAAIIIDLHLPGEIPAKLSMAYEQQYKGKIQLNEGQILGMYLRDKNLNYFYMTAYLGKYKQELESGRGSFVLDKESNWGFFEQCLSICLS